jgi:hypothetical protein
VSTFAKQFAKKCQLRRIVRIQGHRLLEALLRASCSKLQSSVGLADARERIGHFSNDVTETGHRFVLR